MKNFRYIIIPAALSAIIAVVGCQRFDIIHIRGTCSNLEYARMVREVKVREGQVPLFADLSDYELTGKATRSDNGKERLFQLADLLDMDDVRTETFCGCCWRQTAFIQNGENVLAAIDDVLDDDTRATMIKKYLIEKYNEDGSSDIFVVAMITSYDFAQARGIESFDFLDKSNFNGAVIFSNIDGTLREIHYYKNGMILDAEPLKYGQELPEGERLMYIAVAEESAVNTRAVVDDIVPSYCYAWSNPIAIIVPKEGWITQKESGEYVMGVPNIMESNKAGARTGNTQERNEMEMTCTVRLMVDNPKLGKISSGNGTFSKGTTITIVTEPVVPLPVELCQFQYWSGAFKGAGPRLVCIVTQDITSVAHWGERPCVDSTQQLGNPLLKMKIASTQSYHGNDGNVNYWGGVFGTDNRIGIDNETGERYKKGHKGIDIEATPGSEAFAIHDGVITRIVGNSIASKGSGYGNIIEYTTMIDGRRVMFRYAHLQYGSPIAINPYTGNPYKVGDIVEMGDVIGYTGATGNAWNVPNKHLHLEVHVDGVPVDPRDWINATYGSNKTELNNAKGAVMSKRCDNKNQTI